MTNFSLRILLILSCLSIIACSNNEENPTPVVSESKVFYAQVPSSDAGTKTFIDGDWNMYWFAGDLLSVFQSATNEQYRFAGTSGEIVNEFHKCDSSTPGAAYSRNYAVYPYSDATLCDSNGEITISFPAVQKYSPDTFGQDANTMVAVTQSSADDVFYFRNVCGYLRLKIYGGDTIRRIVLRGNNGEKIAGEATITVAYDTAPSVVLGESATTEITLDCGKDGVETVDDPDQYTSFWIVVPPVTFTKGFTVDITTLNGNTRSQTTDKSITITQNKVKQMAAFECGSQLNPMLYTFSISDGVHTYKAFDISDEYVDIMVPNQSDLSNMTAKFSYRGASVKVDDVEQRSGENAHDFSDFASPIEYIVSAADETSQTYKVRIFDLPVIYIDTPNHQGVTSKTVWIEGATIKMRNTDNSEIDLGLTAVKGRGNSTWNYPKKPYALKFDSKQSFFGLPKHKRWCLLANWMDKTLLRNSVSYEIARKCTGFAWTPDGDYVEVILNGQHIGNYYLCEQIKIDSNRVDISEDNGFILTVDLTWDEAYKFKSATKQLPYMFKDPDEVTSEQFSFIESYVNEMEESLYDDTKFAVRDYLDYLDISSTIDYWLTYELAMNHEPENPKSVYMYKDGDGVLFFGPVWDFDWGTYLPGRSHSWQTKNTALYYPRLFTDQKYVNDVYSRWISQKSLFEEIPDFLDTKAAQIRSSEARDRTIWPFTNTTNGEVGLTYDQAVARMRQAYLDKLSWMDAQIKNMVQFDSSNGGTEDFPNQGDATGDFDFN